MNKTLIVNEHEVSPGVLQDIELDEPHTNGLKGDEAEADGAEAQKAEDEEADPQDDAEDDEAEATKPTKTLRGRVNTPHVGKAAMAAAMAAATGSDDEEEEAEEEAEEEEERCFCVSKVI